MKHRKSRLVNLSNKPEFINDGLLSTVNAESMNTSTHFYDIQRSFKEGFDPKMRFSSSQTLQIFLKRPETILDNITDPEIVNFLITPWNILHLEHVNIGILKSIINFKPEYMKLVVNKYYKLLLESIEEKGLPWYGRKCLMGEMPVKTASHYSCNITKYYDNLGTEYPDQTIIDYERFLDLFDPTECKKLKEKVTLEEWFSKTLYVPEESLLNYDPHGDLITINYTN